MVDYGFNSAVFAAAAILLVNGLRRKGWARLTCIAMAVIVLLGGFWHALVRATAPLASQQSSAAGQSVQGLPTIRSVGPDGVEWRGRVTISPSAGLDLDSVPPKPGTDSDSDVRIVPPGQDRVTGGENSGGFIAPWTGRTPPRQSDCLAQVMSDQEARVTIRPGSIVCVETPAGQIAALKFVSVTGDHGTDAAEATIWGTGF